jgi:hypothetical protein
VPGAPILAGGAAFGRTLRLKGSDTWSEHGNRDGLQLRWAIGKVLYDRTATDIPQLYLDFARQLTTSDRVLTLNYDLVLERALAAVGLPFRLCPWLTRRSTKTTPSPTRISLRSCSSQAPWIPRLDVHPERGRPRSVARVARRGTAIRRRRPTCRDRSDPRVGPADLLLEPQLVVLEPRAPHGAVDREASGQITPSPAVGWSRAVLLHARRLHGHRMLAATGRPICPSSSCITSRPTTQRGEARAAWRGPSGA